MSSADYHLEGCARLVGAVLHGGLTAHGHEWLASATGRRWLGLATLVGEGVDAGAVRRMAERVFPRPAGEPGTRPPRLGAGGAMVRRWR